MKYKLNPALVFPWAVWILFIASLPLTALELDFSQEDISLYHEKLKGYEVLLYGWAGLAAGSLGWLANPFLLIGAVILRQAPRVALVLGLIGMGLALTSFGRYYYWIDEHFRPYVNAWGFGCYLWLLSFVALIYGAAYLEFHNE